MGLCVCVCVCVCGFTSSLFRALVASQKSSWCAVCWGGSYRLVITRGINFLTMRTVDLRLVPGCLRWSQQCLSFSLHDLKEKTYPSLQH